jgi:hypothetical protein
MLLGQAELTTMPPAVPGVTVARHQHLIGPMIAKALFLT